jgi:4-carboxymuconolactone decarboxylase
MRLKEPRIPPLSRSEWTPEIAELLQKASGVSDEPLNIFATLVRHPGLFKRWMVFGTHVLFKNTLPARDRELAILRVGWLCQAEYEFGQHARIGKQCGLTDEEIRRAIDGPSAPDWSDAERALLQATDELHAHQMIEDTTWSALNRSYDVRQIFDLLFTVGQYVLVSMVLNSIGVQLENGAEGFPQDERQST